MASALQLIRRGWRAVNPPQPAKTENALRIGLLGASTIAPAAIIVPAKSHPEVIIAAVAARDQKRAQAYAKKHSIPIVHTTYQELIDDPAIDAVYIPLPNGLHFEWALKSLKAGKHVLLEKPSVSNAAEASKLFRHPILSQPNAPVLLEAFHSRFHPAWQAYVSLLDQPNIASARSESTAPSFLFGNDDIRYIYDLSGGTLMDFGTYGVMFLRQMFGTEPEECIESTPRLMPEGFDQKCDQAIKAKWRFPNGGIGSVSADLSVPFYQVGMPVCEAVHKEVVIVDESLGEGSGKEHVMVKTVTMWMSMMPVFWHRIDIIENHTIQTIHDKKAVKSWSKKEYKTAYTWQDGQGRAQVGEDWWSTYRYELEEFVNKIRGREGSGVWMDGEDSIRQMSMVDSGYVKAGLPLRPTSSYQLAD